LFKKILKINIGHLIKQKEAFTLSLNTDGISLQKPHFNVVPEPIISSRKLENGINFLKELDSLHKFLKFYLIAAIFDKPAKAAILNIISYNGFGGCTKCLQLGETVLTEKGGHTHIYPFNKQNPTGPARTD